MLRPALVAVLLLASAASAQPDSLAGRYAVYVDGEPSDLAAVVDAAAAADVVLLGERHDDTVAHALQLRVLQGVHERMGAGRPVALGLEMFEADVQPVLDEYLAGVAEERDLTEGARPWSNYADYRPLVEYARAHGLPVVATNATARHVRLVAREGGVEALDRLPAASLAVYPPRPLAGPSDALAAAFADAMGGMAGHGGPSAGGMLAAQNLRDLTMAHRIADAGRGGALVVHLNGSFHSAGGLGIPEHLAREAPDARVLVVTFEPTDDLTAPPPNGESNASGVVVLTRADG
ncbi:ChaN family lipoprotein [Rubrivirga litoralis]|uniref:ChaN family lipoprotein n=1 Tax=Rubrivirga litoralis TaxID=3075598 RepID=A0ABU3BPT2_9BACT|nr:ChaN family lipoprotein [Rubrivirga sp. F394]MDT0631285.1 ChaN family lipoprotein [Rubrivirga sp. F394]